MLWEAMDSRARHTFLVDISLRLINSWWASPNDAGSRAEPGFWLDWKGTLTSPQLTQKGKRELRVCFLSGLNLLTDFSARPWCKLSEHLAFLQASAREQFVPLHTRGEEVSSGRRPVTGASHSRNMPWNEERPVQGFPDYTVKKCRAFPRYDGI